MSPSAGRQTVARVAPSSVITCLPVRFSASISSALDEKALAVGGSEQEAAGWLEQRQRRVVLAHLHHQAQRLAIAAAARDGVGTQREGAALRGEDDDAVGGLGMQPEGQRVTLLEAQLGILGQVAFLGADPALLGEDDGDGLTLDEGRFVHLDGGGGAADDGAAGAERAIAEFLPGLLHLSRDGTPAPGFARHQRVQPGLLLRELVVLAADFHFLQAAQAAQAHVQHGVGLDFGQAECPHQGGARLIFLAHDADDLVEVQIDDEVAVEDFEAPGDMRQAMRGAALQHLVPVVEPFAQHLAQAP